jgi:hypothetical protein
VCGVGERGRAEGYGWGPRNRSSRALTRFLMFSMSALTASSSVCSDHRLVAGCLAETCAALAGFPTMCFPKGLDAWVLMGVMIRRKASKVRLGAPSQTSFRQRDVTPVPSAFDFYRLRPDLRGWSLARTAKSFTFVPRDFSGLPAPAARCV